MVNRQAQVIYQRYYEASDKDISNVRGRESISLLLIV